MLRTLDSMACNGAAACLHILTKHNEIASFALVESAGVQVWVTALGNKDSYPVVAWTATGKHNAP